MKKMNKVYVAPQADVIEMQTSWAILSGSPNTVHPQAQQSSGDPWGWGGEGGE